LRDDILSPRDIFCLGGAKMLSIRTPRREAGKIGLRDLRKWAATVVISSRHEALCSARSALADGPESGSLRDALVLPCVASRWLRSRAAFRHRAGHRGPLRRVYPHRCRGPLIDGIPWPCRSAPRPGRAGGRRPRHDRPSRRDKRLSGSGAGFVPCRGALPTRATLPPVHSDWPAANTRDGLSTRIACSHRV
jgi:hypothetical protein